jgi:hypothetical protein
MYSINIKCGEVQSSAGTKLWKCPKCLQEEGAVRPQQWPLVSQKPFFSLKDLGAAGCVSLLSPSLRRTIKMITEMLKRTRSSRTKSLKKV